MWTNSLPWLGALLFCAPPALSPSQAASPRHPEHARAPPPGEEGAPLTPEGRENLGDGENDIEDAWVWPAVKGGWTEVEVALRAAATAPSVTRALAAREEASEAARRVSVGFLPSLEGLARYNRLSQVDLPDIDFGPENGPGRNPFPVILDRYRLSASADVPISDLFLRILPRYQAALGRARARALEHLAERERSALLGREALLEMVRARSQVAVARASARALARNLEDVSARVRAGTVPPADRLEVEARLADVEVRLARLGASAQVREVALAVLLDLGPDARLESGVQLGPVPASSYETVYALYERAVQARFEVRALEEAIGAASDEKREAIAGMLPSLGGTAQVLYARPNPRIIPQQERFDLTWRAGVALTWSPTGALEAEHLADEAEARVVAARADLQDLFRSLRQEAARALTDHQASRRAAEAAQAGLAAAEETYRVRSRQLAAGVATPREVIDAEAQLAEARATLLDAWIDGRLARARIDRLIASAMPPADREPRE